MAERDKYNIISRGEDTPETLPENGVVFDLVIQPRHKSQENPEPSIARVIPDYVSTLGHYAHVLGIVMLMDNPEQQVCEAKFRLDLSVPKGATIGEFVVKKGVNE